MGTRAKTLERMRKRVNALVEGFGHYVDIFDQANLFTGPSLYFHFRALDLLRNHTSIRQVINDDRFIEILYATLTAWGMHRMGSGGAKLVDFSQFKSSLRQQSEKIRKLENLHIWEVSGQEISRISQLLWGIISNLRVGIGKT